MLFSVHRSLVLLLLLTLFLRQKAKNLRAPPLAACFQELWGDSPGSTDDPNVFYQCIDGDWCSTLRSRAFCGTALLAKTGISSVWEL